MASIEFIQKRITGKEKEIEKLQKKLARIRKAESYNWDDDHNPYYYSEHDLRYCLRDIEEAQKGLEKYKKQLEEAIEKENSRDVKVILDFLEIWKDKVREFYGEGLRQYYLDLTAVRNAIRAADKLMYQDYDLYKEEIEAATKMQNEFHTDCYGTYERRDFINRWGKPDHTDVKVKEGKYEFLKPYRNEESYEAAMAKLNSELDQEAARKYDFIIERTNWIVGQITDASGLKIGAKQDLNGYIIGTKGTAKVQTIGAGGYNIQCFHFRTLIHEVK